MLSGESKTNGKEESRQNPEKMTHGITIDLFNDNVVAVYLRYRVRLKKPEPGHSTAVVVRCLKPDIAELWR